MRLLIAAIFIAVGLGALVVTLVYEPTALVPRPPYGEWILVRSFVLAGLACLGLLLVFGVVDDPLDIEDENEARAFHWRAVGLAFLAGVVASATFIAATALTDYLDRCLAGAC